MTNQAYGKRRTDWKNWRLSQDIKSDRRVLENKRTNIGRRKTDQKLTLIW